MSATRHSTEDGGNAPERDLWLEFQAGDTDGDGRIDLEEFRRVLQTLGAISDPRWQHAAFARIDVAGAGRIGWAQFDHWWHGS